MSSAPGDERADAGRQPGRRPVSQPADGRRLPGGHVPRLGAHERLAGQLTRSGRFAAIDPTTGRPPPGWLRWVGFAAWVLFCEESLRRARAEVRGDAPP